jgi:hypothetical protein
MSRAETGAEVTVVIAIDAGGHERIQVFSTVETAQGWANSLSDDVHCVIIDPMIVDVPEYGNEAALTRG